MNADKLKLLAPDLRQAFPRSPRATLGGYVLAARCVDKCRAELNGSAGEYHYDCPLDKIFLDFAALDAEKLKDFVATGATDGEVAQWIADNATKRERVEIIQWNNQQRDLRLSDLPAPLQEFMEGYIEENVPRHRPVYHWFDVFDLEEQRL